MKRLVWGIVLAIIGIIGFSADAPQEGQSVAILFMLGGGAMAFFGYRHIQRARDVAAIALQMLREDGKLDAAQLATRVGLSEVDVRPLIAEAQRKGLIGFKVDIV